MCVCDCKNRKVKAGEDKIQTPGKEEKHEGSKAGAGCMNRLTVTGLAFCVVEFEGNKKLIISNHA